MAKSGNKKKHKTQDLSEQMSTTETVFLPNSACQTKYAWLFFSLVVILTSKSKMVDVHKLEQDKIFRNKISVGKKNQN